MIMDIFNQKKVLDSFEILVDTREQDTERAHRRYASFGAPIRRATLNYGDYTYNAVLPDGRQIYDPIPYHFPFVRGRGKWIWMNWQDVI